MPPNLALQLTPDVVVTEDEQGFIVADQFSALRFRRADRAVRILLERLADGGESRESLCDSALSLGESGDVGARARLHFMLDQMERRGLLSLTISPGGRRLATFEPMGPMVALEAVSPDESFLLSRFAYLRRIDDCMVTESPLGRARVMLHDWRCAGLLSLLATPRNVEELATEAPEMDAASLSAFVGFLVGARAAFICPDGRTADRSDAALHQWEFHDLLFHSRSRPGRHNYPYGATFRFLEFRSRRFRA